MPLRTSTEPLERTGKLRRRLVEVMEEVRQGRRVPVQDRQPEVRLILGAQDNAQAMEAMLARLRLRFLASLVVRMVAVAEAVRVFLRPSQRARVVRQGSLFSHGTVEEGTMGQQKQVYLINPERQLKKESGLSGRQWRRQRKATRLAVAALSQRQRPSDK